MPTDEEGKRQKGKSVMDLRGVVKSKVPIEDMDQVIQEAKEAAVKRKRKEGRL